MPLKVQVVQVSVIVPEVVPSLEGQAFKGGKNGSPVEVKQAMERPSKEVAQQRKKKFFPL
jgi:hypothetical protein